MKSEGVAVDGSVSGQLYGCSVGDVNEIITSALAHLVAFGGLPFNNAHYLILCSVNAYALSESLFGALIIGLRHIKSNDRNLLSCGNVCVLDETAFLKVISHDIQIVLRNTCNRSV